MVCTKTDQGATMSFALYMLGFVIFLGGLIWGAVEAGIPHLYIGIGATVMLGLGIFSAVGRTRSKDPA
jgi:glycerate kinase